MVYFDQSRILDASIKTAKELEELLESLQGETVTNSFQYFDRLSKIMNFATFILGAIEAENTATGEEKCSGVCQKSRMQAE